VGTSARSYGGKQGVESAREQELSTKLWWSRSCLGFRVWRQDASVLTVYFGVMLLNDHTLTEGATRFWDIWVRSELNNETTWAKKKSIWLQLCK